MKKYFVDTNIFLRTLVKEDETAFRGCYLFLEAVKTNKIKAATANIVLAEVVWTLQSYYDFSKEKTIEAVQSILNLRGLDIVDSYDSSWSIKQFQKHNVKYVDTLIASIVKEDEPNWVVVSYDEDFDKLGVVRKQPGELVAAEE